MTQGPGRHSPLRDRIHIPDSGLSPGEVADSRLSRDCDNCFESSGQVVQGSTPTGIPLDPAACESCGGTGRIPVVLGFSHDWVEALGWRDPPEVTVEAIFAVVLWVTKTHGYRLQKDRTRSKPTDWQNFGPKKVGCKCGSPEMPCPEFERYRLLLTALGAGEGHNPILATIAAAHSMVKDETIRRLQGQLDKIQRAQSPTPVADIVANWPKPEEDA